jgi:DNA polymerase-3 subunit gamma/tau
VTGATAHQALYRRWRAQRFAEIVGQDAVVETLRNAVRTEHVAHAILFTGPRGTGKTSLARILAKALNCTNLGADGDPCDTCDACVAIRDGAALDVVEIDAASNRGINEVRELRERLAYAPAQLRRKVYILDEAHQITKDAWNALLKSLEEPPEFVTFMFASTHPQEFPPAILSRLQRFDVRRLTVAEITGKLGRILEADGRASDPAAIELIARLAAGGMRDAESILDQVLASGGDRITADGVRELLGLADAEAVDGFVDALATGDAAAGLAILDALEDRGRDLRVFLDQVVEALRLRLISGIRGAPTAERVALTRAAHRFAALDPTRIGPGGLRLRIELALLDTPVTVAAAAPAADPAVRQPAPAQASDGRTDARAPAPTRVKPQPAPARDEPSPAVEVEPQVVEPGPTEPEPGPADPDPRAASTPAPAAAAPEAAPAPDETAASPHITVGTPEISADLDRLRHGWAEIVASVRPATKALISECRPLSVDGATITLGFPESKAFLKDVAERKKADLEAAVGGYLGRPVGVVCVATNLDLVPPLPGDQEAERILAEARRIFADDLAAVPEVD